VRRWKAWVDTSDALLAHWLRAARDALLGEMPILAAGTALFAIFAVVPTLAAVVSMYGVIADPHEIQSHLRGLATVLPPDVLAFITTELERQAERGQGELGVALAISVGLAIVASRGAARALVDALNRAYRVRELRTPLHKLAVTLISFGFKYGLPLDFNLVFDVRFLPNPYFEPALTHLDGRDPEVSKFVLGADGQELTRQVEGLLRFTLPHFQKEGTLYVTICLGCTGGRHRSVAIVEELRRRLGGEYDMLVRHRDVERGG
jgi:hypothetical protein